MVCKCLLCFHVFKYIQNIVNKRLMVCNELNEKEWISTVTWDVLKRFSIRGEMSTFRPSRMDICFKDPQAEFFCALNSILTSCIPLHQTNKRQVKRVFLPLRGGPSITCFDPENKKLSHSWCKNLFRSPQSQMISLSCRIDYNRHVVFERWHYNMHFGVTLLELLK